MGETATGICTWDAVPPYRMGLADVNAAALRFRGLAPWDPRYVPQAGALNGQARTAVGFASTLANAKVSIAFRAGAPVVSAQATIAGHAAGASAPAFTVARMTGGAVSGDLFVSWPAGAFPTATVRPRARINGFVPGCICADWATVASVAGVRVVTVTHASVATDFPFTLEIN